MAILGLSLAIGGDQDEAKPPAAKAIGVLNWDTLETKALRKAFGAGAFSGQGKNQSSDRLGGRY